MNVYVYVHNNPVNFIDPLGLSEEYETLTLGPLQLPRGPHPYWVPETTSEQFIDPVANLGSAINNSAWAVLGGVGFLMEGVDEGLKAADEWAGAGLYEPLVNSPLLWEFRALRLGRVLRVPNYSRSAKNWVSISDETRALANGSVIRLDDIERYVQFLGRDLTGKEREFLRELGAKYRSVPGYYAMARSAPHDFGKKVWKFWHEGTFFRKSDTIAHHYKEQVINRGLKMSVEEYTQEALEFFSRYKNQAQYIDMVPLKKGTGEAIRITVGNRLGVYTQDGKILTYHP